MVARAHVREARFDMGTFGWVGVGVGVWALALVFVLALCRMAKLADEDMERARYPEDNGRAEET